MTNDRKQKLLASMFPAVPSLHVIPACAGMTYFAEITDDSPPVESSINIFGNSVPGS